MKQIMKKDSDEMRFYEEKLENLKKN